jgi:general secretion pathway protein D
MRNVILAAAACWLGCAALPALADQSASEVSAREPATTVPLERLIAGVARKTGKTFVIDPRVRAEVLIIARSPPDFSYEQLLGVLSIYGFIAYEDAGLVRVVPDVEMKTIPTPVITSKETRPADEVVTEVVALKHASAAQMVPILRPMVPQAGTLVAYASTNSMVITDHFANLRRMEQLVRALDDTPLWPKTAPAPESGGATEH